MYDLIPKGSCTYNTCNQDKIETHYCRTDLFKYSLFPYMIVKWNKFDVTVRNAKSLLIFKNLLLKIGRPIQNSIFKIHDPLGIKLLTRLRLGLSHLNEHRFRHNFQDYVSHYVPVVWKLNRIFIFSYIAKILYNLVKPS